VIEVVGGAIFCVFSLCFLIGLIAVVEYTFSSAIPSERRIALVVLALEAMYILASLQVIGSSQDRLRNPAEFAMCILAVLGASRALALIRHSRIFDTRTMEWRRSP
jgi:hypothetical protein